MKKLLTISVITILAVLVSWVNSCKKSDHNAGGGGTSLSFSIPNGFPKPHYRFDNNPLTEEGFQLGRKLFYEGKLSKDGNFPCASCHQQFAGFATYDHDLSHGFNNQFTTRNAPGLFNLVWQKELHWDGGINNLEVQPLAPITAPNEMAEDINTVVQKLQQDAAYRSLFKAAFGTEEVNSQRLLKALAQFTGMMVSANSKYDQVLKGTATFNSSEQAGYAVFQAKCASCHTEPLFTDGTYRNNGLPLNASLKDFGRMRITGKATDSLKFKVPSLRNLAITSPYTHDGRFYSMGEMIDHYISGIQQSATLDPLLTNKIALTALEKYNLLSFLRTLTDSSFIGDKRFTQP